MQLKQRKLVIKWNGTSALTRYPLSRKIFTTLRPTPPVAPVTKMTSEVPIALCGSGDVPFDSLEMIDSMNCIRNRTQLGKSSKKTKLLC